MRDWSWKDLGIRPLVFPVLALGAGCALPELTRSRPAGAACLARCLAVVAFGTRRRPAAHLALLVSAVLMGSVLAVRSGETHPLPTGAPVRLARRALAGGAHAPAGGGGGGGAQ